MSLHIERIDMSGLELPIILDCRPSCYTVQEEDTQYFTRFIVHIILHGLWAAIKQK